MDKEAHSQSKEIWPLACLHNYKVNYSHQKSKPNTDIIDKKIMKRSSSSSSTAAAVAILAIMFIYCSLPCSVAVQDLPEGDRPGVGPPSPIPGSGRHKCPGCDRPNTPPPPPHRKTLLVGTGNTP
ncbi:uncharacterized protein LOC125547502 isoform X2 [Triticum urartu]|uniref:uncharacterized protein LOC125547502 isoform X2 n=1 Tax=Triticum urartu TaxID=4572 RepID=UPI002043FE03|nr:uncharacterized protein LOC125547502 isoform X2 [Triticum urartu]